ncbi:Putative zinc finger and SCAN domain-containing 5D [Gossypium arboreum]|uniref:Putative zinc finger and SCAN domain-containing 5D n=1 Tax=Gossypium arboreum TaxID=29729 RepID=A0A0B0MEK0_GOSAR|nr:Putative zinc finger and SCAN domain-containing 5D [Gossypium arboreum]
MCLLQIVLGPQSSVIGFSCSICHPRFFRINLLCHKNFGEKHQKELIQLI